MRAKEVSCYFTVSSHDLQYGEILRRVPKRFENCVSVVIRDLPRVGKVDRLHQ